MFSFVDQIVAISDTSIRGRFAVPEHFEGAPDWLIFEAIGQLAAWRAMRDSDFSKRPVGATVGSLDFAGLRRPCGVLDLMATIDRTDRRAILYGGEVWTAGESVAVMRRCIGPLLPMEAFDDPDHARERFAALTGPEPVRLWAATDPLPSAWTSALEPRAGGGVCAEFRVDEDASFFQDHFPRQPVVPATLLIDAMCRVGATSVALHLGRTEPVLFDQVRQVKVRQFTKPGQLLRIEADRVHSVAGKREVHVAAFSVDDLVAGVVVSCGL
jgi:3-hydroxymyristoyl/3-hydroxydecanoyl-(acyl carrier protein) dehydratase